MLCYWCERYGIQCDELTEALSLNLMLSSALYTVARIALVKPEKARGVEDVILRAAQMGQIVEKVDV